MIDPRTGHWRDMLDPATRQPGRPVRVTVGDVPDPRWADDGIRPQLYVHHEDDPRGPVHPVELTGDLWEMFRLLRCLEDALANHPCQQEVDAADDLPRRMGEAYDQAHAAVKAARQAVDACWHVQARLYDQMELPGRPQPAIPASGSESGENGLWGL